MQILVILAVFFDITASALVNLTNVTSLNQLDFRPPGEYVSCLAITAWFDMTDSTSNTRSKNTEDIDQLYLWLSTATNVNQISPSEYGKLRINIYDTNLDEYNGPNTKIEAQLPFNMTLWHELQFLQSISCTSPSSHSIIQCFQYFVENDKNSYLKCMIYFSSNSSFSEQFVAITFEMHLVLAMKYQQI